MEGFESIIPQEWEASDWSKGCQRKVPLNCGSEYGFKRVSGVKLPDTRKSWYNHSMTLRECDLTCRNDCSCMAYANLDSRNGGSGCLIWFDELRDIAEFDDGDTIYIRMAATELAARSCIKRKKMLHMKKQGELEYTPLAEQKISNETKSSMLDWPHRFHIIHGMARGILYLHQDSRLQIIHRDLKAGNILLDSDWNPKISDFGLARMFVGQDASAKTKKVVGTYGYISPEYAVHGRFSVKSDVFSFGVMVLEIVSGMKNREFSHENHRDNLLGHAWRLYKENKSIELMSETLRGSAVVSELLRSIHVALLCVQHHAEDRPTMLSVVLMLVSESALPEPNQPAFFTEQNCTVLDTISANQTIKDGQTVVSKGEMFELGFFSPGKSKNRYLGIWYKKISEGTVVRVANRQTPINDTSGMFKVSREGNLLLFNGGNNIVWSSNWIVSLRSNNTEKVVARLLDNGNLIVRDKSLSWQSFDYPGDTILPGMKVGKDLVTGIERFITSWKSLDDPSIGVYTTKVDTNGYPQTFSWRAEFVVNQKEVHYKYELKSSVFLRIVLTWDGKTLIMHWIERILEWAVYADLAVDSCGRFGLCGPYGICSINKHPPCTCIIGFEPKIP
ncbi:G-type lectin S-receptor-like serine/threonine-protein kinase [Tanacetum coccineum]